MIRSDRRDACAYGLSKGRMRPENPIVRDVA
jgi:hypothetical protein